MSNVRLLSVSHANEMGFGAFPPCFKKIKKKVEAGSVLGPFSPWKTACSILFQSYILKYILIKQFRKTQLLLECLRQSTKQSSCKKMCGAEQESVVPEMVTSRQTRCGGKRINVCISVSRG